MKIAHVSIASWVIDVVDNRNKVTIRDDEGFERVYDTRGVVGTEIETAVVRFSDNFVVREVPFEEVMRMRTAGMIWSHL